MVFGSRVLAACHRSSSTCCSVRQMTFAGAWIYVSDDDSAQMLQALDAFDCTSPGRREISPLEAQINLLEFQCMPLPLLLNIRGLHGTGDST